MLFVYDEWLPSGYSPKGYHTTRRGVKSMGLVNKGTPFTG